MRLRFDWCVCVLAACSGWSACASIVPIEPASKGTVPASPTVPVWPGASSIEKLGLLGAGVEGPGGKSSATDSGMLRFGLDLLRPRGGTQVVPALASMSRDPNVHFHRADALDQFARENTDAPVLSASEMRWSLPGVGSNAGSGNKALASQYFASIRSSRAAIDDPYTALGAAGRDDLHEQLVIIPLPPAAFTGMGMLGLLAMAHVMRHRRVRRT